MAHEIDMSNGRANMFAAGEAPWHKLGALVSECQKSDEAIDLAGLNWSVDKCPLRTLVASGDKMLSIEVPDNYACVRDDTHAVLGVVGSRYRPYQNREAFDFMDSIVGEKLAMFESAGSLRGGKHVWMLAKLPKDIRVAGDDIVKPYVLICNSHDGTSGLRIIPTTVRVVCMNTLMLALRQAGSTDGLVINHTQALDRKVADAREKLRIIGNRMGVFEIQAQSMAAKSLGTKELSDFFATVLTGQTEKFQKRVGELWIANYDNSRNTMKGMKHSVWAAYNAVSEWADHQFRVNGRTDLEKADNRVTSMWFGTANDFKQAAFKAALDLVS